MNLFKKVLLLVCLYLLATPIFAQVDSTVFNILPKTVHPGTTITVRYSTTKTPLKGKNNIQGLMYQYHSNFTWSVQDIVLQKKDSVWQSQVVVADNSALILFSFNNDTITDNGKVWPYAWMVTEKNSTKMVQGGFFAWGTMRNAFLQNTLPFTLDSTTFKDNEVTRMWIRNELKAHLESRPYVFKTSFLLYKQNNDINTIAPSIYKELADILQMPNLPEQVWLDAKDVYGNILNDRKAADSLEKIIVEKYPNGITARDKVINYLYNREKDQAKALKGFEEMLVKFPPADFINVQSHITNLFYGKLFRNTIYQPIIQDSNYSLLYKYISIIPQNELSTFYHHMVEIPHEKKQISDAACLKLSNLIFNEIITRPPPALYSPKQWSKILVKNNAFCYYTHALILMESGDVVNALKVAENLRTVYNFKNANYNDLYIKLLIANNRSKEVKDYLIKSIGENAATPYMIDYLKKDYLKQRNNTEAGFVKYFEGLKSKDKALEAANTIAASLINEPIAPFNLESSKGGFKNLASLKGKIVVLDFWATWCAPCKAAMPGMALAVNKYKNDTNTVFFFVSTLEYAKDYRTQIAKFIKEKQYPFEVLYDAYNAETQHFDKTYDIYSKAFHFSGIPQKMIIDANGNLRWRSTGYFGSPSALADEISSVVEFLKKDAVLSKSRTYWQGNIGIKRILFENYTDSIFVTAPEMDIKRAKGFAIVRKKDSLNFNAGLLGTYQGTFVGDSILSGELISQTKQKNTLTLKKVTGLQPLLLPQTPKPPFNYASKNLYFSNADASIRFGGTLTIPHSGFTKAVVLVSGTGKQNRDGTMAGHKMFAVIADYLSRNGIAVFRIDDRGTGETTGKYEEATTEDFANDALAAVSFLQSMPEFANKQIGLAGHSEGGAAIAIAAAKSGSVKFLISLSGLASTGVNALLFQNKNIVHMANIPQLNKDRFDDINRLMFQTAYQYADSANLEKKLRETFNTWFEKDSKMIDSLQIKYDHFLFPIESFIRQATGKWYRYHVKFNPENFIPKVKVPVLAIYGDKDIMVDGAASIANWKNLLPKGNNQQFTSYLLPSLNHLLQHCNTCIVAESPDLEETISPEVLEKMKDWIIKN